MSRKTERSSKVSAKGKSSRSELVEGPLPFRPFEAVAKAAKASKAAEAKRLEQEAERRRSDAHGKSRAGTPKTAASKTPGGTLGTRSSSGRPAVEGPASGAASGMGERETFAMYMAGVRSLGDGALRVPATASRVERTEGPVAPAPDLDAPAREKLRALVVEGLRFELSDDGGRIEGRRLDLDHRQLRLLRRGAFAIDGRLDLHGLGSSEARAAVEAFIKKRAVDGDKVVLLIHGKGAHSAGGQGVLRGEIGAWLSQGLASKHVRAFTTALDEDGGEGALLVLLAR